MITTGIRVGELVGLRHNDMSTKRPAHIVVTGKGRKQRITPLDKPTTATLTAWTRANPPDADTALFPARGRTQPMSRDAVAQRVALHTNNAANQARSLHTKNVTPHTLRHICAMRMLASGIHQDLRNQHRHNTNIGIIVDRDREVGREAQHVVGVGVEA